MQSMNELCKAIGRRGGGWKSESVKAALIIVYLCVGLVNIHNQPLFIYIYINICITKYDVSHTYVHDSHAFQVQCQCATRITHIHHIHIWRWLNEYVCVRV